MEDERFVNYLLADHIVSSRMTSGALYRVSEWTVERVRAAGLGSRVLPRKAGFESRGRLAAPVHSLCARSSALLTAANAPWTAS